MIPLVVPVPVSVNRWIRPAKHGGLHKTAEAVAWQEEAGQYALVWRRQARWRPTICQKVWADWWVWWPAGPWRDTHNLEKVMWDAFEGILYDNDHWLLSRCQDFAEDVTHPRVEIVFSLTQKGESIDDTHHALGGVGVSRG